MDNVKDDIYYIDRIRNDLQFIVDHMENVGPDEFSSNELLQDAMMFRLIQISENSQRLSAKCKSENDTVPWKAVYGLRNRIVHDYGNVDLSIVYNTLTKDIPELLMILNTVFNGI